MSRSIRSSTEEPRDATWGRLGIYVRISICVFLAHAGCASALAQETQQIEFAGQSWTAMGDEVRVEEFRGHEAMRLRSSVVRLDEIEFENGTIEYDFATTGHRAFVGVAFRAQPSGRDREYFYLRPHQSGRFDAMQYVPVNNMLSAWQLYPEYNAEVEIPRDDWLHVRLEISGSHLDVFFDDAAEPALTVDRLRRGPGEGAVEVRAFFPGGEPEDLYPNAIANFRVRPAPPGGDYVSDPGVSPGSGIIGRWTVSPPFEAPETPITSLPQLSDGGWRTVETESDGRLDLATLAGIPEDADRGTVLARVVIESDRDQVKRLNFGFSDEVSIFLNGEVLFTGNNTFMSRSGRYLGIMRLENDALYLPLRAGANELVFAVTEAFGGWGLVARLADLNGVQVAAAP